MTLFRCCLICGICFDGNGGVYMSILKPREKRLKSCKLLYVIVYALGLFVIEYFNRFQIYRTLDNFKFITGLSLLYSVVIISLLSAILLIVPKKLKGVYLGLSYLLITIYMIAHRVYYGLFKEFISIKQMLMIQDTKNMYSDVGIFINDIKRHVRFDYLIIILIAIISVYISIKLIKRDDSKRHLVLLIVLLFVSVGFSDFGKLAISNSESEDLDIFTNKEFLYDTLFSKDKAIEELGIYGYLKQDVSLIFSSRFREVDPIEVTQIADYFEENATEKIVNDYTDIFKDKNLVFILAESLNSTIISPELMPTLHMMETTGLYFDNFYIPAYPRTTCDSEFISQTGLLPSLYSGPTCYLYQENSFPISLANLFMNEGYTANSFHNNVAEFYNRDVLHKSFGFEEFYDSSRLGNKLKIDSSIYTLGKDLVMPDEKFYSFIVSYSGHGGYTERDLLSNEYYRENYEKAASVLDEDTPDEIVVYNAYQMEFDNMLSEFYDDLKSSGRLTDTIFIIFPDHFPYMMDDEMYRDYVGVDEDYQYHKLPFLIWGQDIEPEIISKLGASTDILPTVANLFGLEYNQSDYFGIDLFDEDSESLVVFKDYSWLNDETYFSANPNFNTDKSQEYYDDINDKLYKKIEIFQKILIEDYYQHTEDDNA